MLELESCIPLEGISTLKILESEIALRKRKEMMSCLTLCIRNRLNSLRLTEWGPTKYILVKIFQFNVEAQGQHVKCKFPEVGESAVSIMSCDNATLLGKDSCPSTIKQKQ